VIVDGAVYIPLLTVPTAGDSDQLTPVLVVPLIVAENCFDCPALNDTAVGESNIETEELGVNEMVAVAVLVASAALMAVSITD